MISVPGIIEHILAELHKVSGERETYNFKDVLLVMILGILRLKVAVIADFVAVIGPETVVKSEILALPLIVEHLSRGTVLRRYQKFSVSLPF